MSRFELLKKVSLQAGACLRGFFGTDLEIRKKGELDLVTKADETAEALIIEAIHEAYPNDEILAEESGARPGSNAWRWIIDPLDGTTNFAHGLPHFSVSAALASGDELMAGIVYDPIKQELFVAEKGRGASLNGKKIEVSACRSLGDALSVTGFSYDRRERMDELLERVARLLNNCQGMRRFGSAALDLAYLACGRFDLYLEDGLNPWDIAAGALLVSEAGGFASDFSATRLDLSLGQIIASNSHLRDQIVAQLL